MLKPPVLKPWQKTRPVFWWALVLTMSGIMYFRYFGFLVYFLGALVLYEIYREHRRTQDHFEQQLHELRRKHRSWYEQDLARLARKPKRWWR